MKDRRCWLSCFVLAFCACGGSSSPTTPPTPVLSVAGTYAVVVALGQNSCGPVTVATQATSVTHMPGANRFTLVHGSNSFSGSVTTDGSFTTDPLALNDAGSTLSVVLQGRFSTTGLTATVTVDVVPPAPASACRYLVQWTGTKQGAPNVIP